VILADLDVNLRKQEGTTTQGDVPFTGSGYKSAPNLNHSQTILPVFERSPCPITVDSSLAVDDDEDTKTRYSIGTTVDPCHAQNYVVELSSNSYSKIRKFVNDKNRNMLSMVLLEFVKAFAIKICYDTLT
jgi:hypothetical protein